VVASAVRAIGKKNGIGRLSSEGAWEDLANGSDASYR